MAQAAVEQAKNNGGCATERVFNGTGSFRRVFFVSGGCAQPFNAHLQISLDVAGCYFHENGELDGGLSAHAKPPHAVRAFEFAVRSLYAGAYCVCLFERFRLFVFAAKGCCHSAAGEHEHIVLLVSFNPKTVQISEKMGEKTG